MYKFYKFVLIFLFLFASKEVFASVLNVSLSSNEVKTKDSFVVDLILDTQNESINTIEGDLVFDKNIVLPEKIEVNNSFISFWVEQPIINDSNKIHFSGIVPGGVTLNNGKVFSVIFTTLKEGNTSLSLENTNIFLNDGQGTESKLEVKNNKITVGDNFVHKDIDKKIDKENPENFKIDHTKSPYFYDNKYVAIFNTQDKGSGIKEYKVCELAFTKCVKAVSPYILKNQTIFYSINITAYDNMGNATKSNITSIYLKILILLIILLILVFILYKYYRYLKKNRV